MPVIVGDDDDGSDRRFGCGVLGEGTPWQFDDGRGDGPQNVNSIGVLGMLGSAADLSSFTGDTLGDNMDLPISSAVFGYNVTGYDASATGVVPSFGFIAGSHPRYGAAGLYGESDTRGAICVAAGAVGVGVVGLAGQSGANFDVNSGGTGVLGSGYIGIRGETAAGVAVLGQASGQGLAGLFAGNVQVTGGVTVAGDVRVDGDLFLKNRDVCERFPAASSTALKKGMVMVVNDTGSLAPCTCPYDPRVIGVISGAGRLRPAITLGADQDLASTVPIALVGTAFCFADATEAPIKIGDILTSSARQGHAMKAADATKSVGAIIGKALASLDRGQALIPIVITLR